MQRKTLTGGTWLNANAGWAGFLPPTPGSTSVMPAAGCWALSGTCNISGKPFNAARIVLPCMQHAQQPQSTICVSSTPSSGLESDYREDASALDGFTCGLILPRLHAATLASMASSSISVMSASAGSGAFPLSGHLPCMRVTACFTEANRVVTVCFVAI